MEKRLPLALFLSLLVYFGWLFLFGAPNRRPAEVGGPEAGATAPVPAKNLELDEFFGADPNELPPPAEADGEEQIFELWLGRAEESEGARWWARFSNRGGLLLELRESDYFVHELVTDGDEDPRQDTDNWTPLLLPIETGTGRTGSLAWTTNKSSRALTNQRLDQALWKATVLTGPDGKQSGMLFRYGPGTGVVFEKRIETVPGTRRLRVELTIENQSLVASGERQFVFTPAACVPPELDDRFYIEPVAAAAGPFVFGAEQQKGIEYDSVPMNLKGEPTGALDVQGPLAFAGAFNKYFAVLMHGADADAVASMVSARYRRVADATWAEANEKPLALSQRFVAADVDLKLFLPEVGQRRSWTYEVYAGPKRRENFLTDSRVHDLVLARDLASIPCAGFIIPAIGEVLIAVLKILQRIVGNWGVAIILLTVCIRALLFPLNRRSQTSMARYQKKMKRVQPKIDEVKKKYEKNPQKLRQEQARIMQEEKAFPPLGGCLPVFLQMPIFFGLFSALRTSFDLRQAPFYGWITDLSRPDRMFEINLQLPLVGTIEYFNLLPPLMVVLWILQQKTMPTPTDEQQARMQKMMMFMPVVMGVFLYNYAAGLSLYMITQSGLGIFEQAFIKKKWPVKDDEPDKPKRGCGPFSGIMQNLAEKQAAQMKRLQAAQEQQRKSGGKGAKRKK